MRKVVLFGLALVLSASVVAQTNLRSAVKHNNDLKKQKEVSKDDPTVAGPTIPWNRPNVTVPKGTSDVVLIPMFASVNVYSILLPGQNALDYNQDINTIMFSARGGGDVGNPVIGTSNDIVTATSNDGANFQSAVAALGSTSERYRYPSGVFYNPTGNTDPNAAFKLFQAPITSGSGWMMNRFTTVSFDGASNFKSDITFPAGVESPLVRESLATFSNGTAISTAMYTEDDGSVYTLKQPRFYKGTFDEVNKGFIFEESNLTPDIPCLNPTYSGIYPVAAFDNTGMIGYYVVIADDSRAEAGYPATLQPVVYKTTDGGATWSLMNYINLVNHPVLLNESNLWGALGTANVVKPLFDEIDAVVDNTGALHIFGTVLSCYSNDPDSIGFTYKYETGGVLELFNPNGGEDWMMNWVSNLQTKTVDAEVSGYGSGSSAQGWDMRLQAGKSADGEYVYAIWTDTDTTFWGMTLETALNLYPDVYGFAHKVSDNYLAPATNFTANTDFLGDNYFIYASQHCMVNNGDITIPVTNADIKFNNNPDLAVGHRYISGIGFTADKFAKVGVNEVAKNISNVQVYPNPATSEATINFNMNKAGNVDIQIVNMLGQTVYSTRVDAVAGANTTKIDVASYKAGMYFYTMIANGKKTTGKISVR